jgi:acetyltransferase
MRHKVISMIVQEEFNTYQTSSGLWIHVRPLMPQDAPYLVDLFENMGSASRYSRFLQPLDQVDLDIVWSEAEQIVEKVPATSYGVLAFVDLPERDDAPVAAARYVRLSPTRAEIAVSVRDDMQHKGIGTELMRLLTIRAGEEGIEQLVGTVQNSNAPMWAMLKKLDYRVESRSEGTYSEIIIHLRESAHRREDYLDAAADYSPEPQLVW